MAELAEDSFLLPLFPLPNLVFFPETRLPLHIFEPRYRSMVSDALEGDRRIGIVLLKPGWEMNYYGQPAVHDIATVGLIEGAVRLEDGRFNLILKGTARIRILEEVERVDSYRVARAINEPEQPAAVEDAYVHREWLGELTRQYLAFMPGQLDLEQLGGGSLEGLTNRLISSLNVDAQQKQSLLEENEVSKRAEQVAALLASRLEMLDFLAPFRTDVDPSKN